MTFDDCEKNIGEDRDREESTSEAIKEGMARWGNTTTRRDEESYKEVRTQKREENGDSKPQRFLVNFVQGYVKSQSLINDEMGVP